MVDRQDLLGARPARDRPRSSRGARTRRRIVDAALSLLEEGTTPPTAQEIADRAGVSLRLIFHHFEDLEALHVAVCELCATHFSTIELEVPADLPLPTRIERTVRRRTALYESLGNLGRNTAALAPSHPGVAAGVAQTHAISVRFLEGTFAPELRRAGRGRKELVGSMAAAVSWQLWDQLRSANALSVASSRRVVTRMLEAAVAEAA